MIKKLFDSRLFVLYLSPFLLGLLSVFSFQPFNFSLINFFILPIFFLLLVYVKKRSKSIYRKKPYLKNLFLIGFAFGFGFYLGGIFWISYSLTIDDSFRYLIPLSVILIPLFLSLFMGLTTLIVGQFINYNFSSVLLFSGSIALSDYIRGKILSGFPWNLWAYSWSWFTEILQILNYIGLYSFNLLVISLFMVPTILFFKESNLKKIFILSSSIILFFGFYIYGTFSINKNNAALNYLNNDEKIYVRVISPSFDLEYNLSLESAEKKLQKMIKYSDPNSLKDRKTLFIWPEGIFTGYSFTEISEFKNLIKKNFSENHLIIFGINIVENPEKYFNSLVVINNNFEKIYQYNKRKLVPFGEFLPLERMLKNVGIKKITEGHISFTRGESYQNLSIHNSNILPLICYEIIFPELLQIADRRTNLIINISEDGWFGDSIGPHQHFAKAIFRAVENNTFLARSANKGISAIISNKGGVVKKLNTYESGNIEMYVPLITSDIKNKNDLIFFILLFTYLSIFLILKKKQYAK